MLSFNKKYIGEDIINEMTADKAVKVDGLRIILKPKIKPNAAYSFIRKEDGSVVFKHYIIANNFIEFSVEMK